MAYAASTPTGMLPGIMAIYRGALRGRGTGTGSARGTGDMCPEGCSNRARGVPMELEWRVCHEGGLMRPIYAAETSTPRVFRNAYLARDVDNVCSHGMSTCCAAYATCRYHAWTGSWRRVIHER